MNMLSILLCKRTCATSLRIFGHSQWTLRHLPDEYERSVAYPVYSHQWPFEIKRWIRLERKIHGISVQLVLVDGRRLPFRKEGVSYRSCSTVDQWVDATRWPGRLHHCCTGNYPTNRVCRTHSQDPRGCGNANVVGSRLRVRG